MAKRKTTRKRRTIRARSPVAKKSYSKRRKSSSSSVEKDAMIGALYGVARPVLDRGIKSLTSRIGVNMLDDFGLPLALYLTAKGKMPMLKSAKVKHYAKVGLIAEATAFGASKIAPMVNLKLFNNSTSSTQTSTIR